MCFSTVFISFFEQIHIYLTINNFTFYLIYCVSGDVISIHSKQADGWWLGELNGIVGIFPATYVEEINEA